MVTFISNDFRGVDTHDEFVDVLGRIVPLEKSKTTQPLTEFLQSKRGSWIILDTETTGLSPVDDKPIMLQIGDAKQRFLVDLRSVQLSRQDVALINSRDIKKIGVNIKFDYNQLKSLGIIMDNLECLLVNEQVLTGGTITDEEINAFKQTCGFYYFSMGGLVFKYLSTMMDKNDRMTFTTISNRPFTINHIRYGDGDIILPVEVKAKQDKKLEKLGFRKKCNLPGLDVDICEFEGLVAQVLGDIEMNGMLLDQVQWKKVGNTFKKLKRDAITNLNKTVVEGKVLKSRQLDMFDPYYTGINWNSTKQKIDILYEFGIIPQDKHGKITTEKNTLMRYEDRHPIVKMLLNYNKATKQETTYGEEFVKKHVDSDGRVRTSFQQVVATGRMSSRDPNLQNIPGLQEVRDAFVAEEGFDITVADYSQQEPRYTAEVCKDPILTDFFLNGDGDSHSLVARGITKAILGEELPITKKTASEYYSEKFGKLWRSIGKTINLGLDYGKSAFSLKYDLGVSQEDAQALYDAAINAFPQKKKYFEDLIVQSLKQGYILTNDITGRKRFFVDFDKFREWEDMVARGEKMTQPQWKAYQKRKGEYSRIIMNTPTQGSAGDMTKLALILLRQRIIQKFGIYPRYQAPIRIIGVVHDEIIVESKHKYTKQVAELLKECMEEAGGVFCKTIPMIAHPCTSNRWFHDE